MKVADYLAIYILWGVNLTFPTLAYPNDFKTSIRSPVPKSGDLLEAKNWRPVVILNLTLKIVEKVLNNKIKSYLKKSGLLSG